MRIICKSFYLDTVREVHEADTVRREAIHRSAKTLNMLSSAMGQEIDSQNKHLDRITQKTDKVDDQIAINRLKLKRIEQRG